MGGVKYRLKPEVFYLLPENCPFVATYLEGGELLFVHFTVTDQALHRIFAGLNRVLELDSPPRATLFGELRHSEWNGELQSLTVNVVWRLMSPDIRREMVLRNALVRQFGNIFQLLESTPPAQVRIAELSETVGMTPGALARKFQRHFGLTLKEFIDGRTLQQAQQLLLGGGDPVASIAERLGFGDPHYFYHFFQKHTGCTPHEFRLRQQ